MTPKSRQQPDTALVRFDGPAPEVAISTDLVRKGVMVAPAIVGLSWLIWGSAGAWSSLYGVGLVLVNFAASAALLSVAARISLAFVMGATLFGYLVRLAFIFAAVWFVAEASWISIPALGATIIVTHLGLLVWELRYVAITLAHSGLAADQPGLAADQPGLADEQPASNPSNTAH